MCTSCLGDPLREEEDDSEGGIRQHGRHQLAKAAHVTRLLEATLATSLISFMGARQKNPRPDCSMLLFLPSPPALDFPSAAPGTVSCFLGARQRGRMATQRSKKGSEKVRGRVLSKVLRRGPAMGFAI